MDRRHRTARGVGVVLLLGALVVGGTSAPALAQSDGKGRKHRIVITGRVDVRKGERTKSVVILDGPAVIRGDVDGVVVAVNGDVRVTGHVSDNVVAVKGRAIIGAKASVGGDVMSSRQPKVAPGATVAGDVRRENFANAFRGLGWALWFGWWLAVTVSILVLGLLFLALAPRAAAAAREVARTRVGPSILWGLAMAIGLPILSLLVLVTLVGIPLGLIGLLSMALFFGLGYVVAALVLGRRIIREPRGLILAFVVGLLILRVVDLIPVLGNLITLAATVFGLGALTIAAWRAARGRTDVGVPAAGARVVQA